MVSGFLGKEVPVFRLRVRISCYPLTKKLRGNPNSHVAFLCAVKGPFVIVPAGV